MTNYQRGRAHEYRIMERLRKEGWLVARTAGSHTPVDVFAAKNGKVLLIQVKSGSASMTPEEKAELARWGKVFNAETQIWWCGGKVKVEVLDGRGRSQRSNPLTPSFQS